VVCLRGELQPWVVAALREAGIVAVCRVRNIDEARAARVAGAQVLIAQATDGDGHELDARMRDAWMSDLLGSTELPVLALCSVLDATGLAHAMALGAQGVVLDARDDDASCFALAEPAGERIRQVAFDAAALLSTKVEPLPEPIEVSSPVCYMAELADCYLDSPSREELLSTLNELLEAERAGARVAMGLASEAPDPEWTRLAEGIRRDEVRWCGVLIRAIQSIDAMPSTRTGDFYLKAAAIEDIGDRVRFLNRGQGWVVRKLQALLPRLREGRMQSELAEMLAAHLQNIDLANAHLAADSRVNARPPAESSRIPTSRWHA